VKPAPFDYAKPSSIDEAVALLARDDNAVALAGGQSLIAALNMRLSAPSLLVDLTGLDELKTISADGERLHIGALVRHAALGASEDVARHAPLLRAAVPYIAHPAIRNRGTIGGSLAQADPAAELPACLIALDGGIEISGPGGPRSVVADAFFKGLYETDLRPGEIITGVTIPLPGDQAAAGNARSAFAELARRRGDYALVGVAAHGTVTGTDGGASISGLRLAYFGVGAKPVLAAKAAAKIEGEALGDENMADKSLALAEAALDDDIDPFDELGASARYKRHLAKVLLGRVLGELAGGNGSAPSGSAP
jgi:carbon-monoxide dehydrogenase medium subunit